MAHVLPELVSYLEGLPEPHILFDRQYRILAANAAYRRQFAPHGSVVGRTCYEVSHRYAVPCDQAGESCPLARARESGQRERVLHLHHTPLGEAYVNIELVPLRDAGDEQAWFVEKMEPLRVAQGEAAAQGLIGRAPAFRQMLELVARVGPSNASVLLLGESGTGKELVARAVHEASPRAAAPLVVVDCASLPETLFESEVFGHERGAFTGASAAKVGLVEAASGGTLFLDEVGDIPPGMQVKLLRLLESGTYRRVGSTELRRSDVRVVSATHRDLPAMVADGRFREDLYYRLATFPIQLPALRERARRYSAARRGAAGARGARAAAGSVGRRAAAAGRARLPRQCARTAQRAGTRGAAVRRRGGGAHARGARAGHGAAGRANRAVGQRQCKTRTHAAGAVAARDRDRDLARATRRASRQPRRTGARAGHQRTLAVPQAARAADALTPCSAGREQAGEGARPLRLTAAA